VGTVTATLAAWVSALGMITVDHAVSDTVDLVEVNHFYDDQGRLVFDQIIFYEWSPIQERYNVRAWRLLKTPAQIPQRNWSRDGYVAIWFDGEVLRKVHCQAMRESWTQYDPELAEREYLPKEQRRELQALRVRGTSTR